MNTYLGTMLSVYRRPGHGRMPRDSIQFNASIGRDAAKPNKRERKALWHLSVSLLASRLLG